ncbi:MAG: GntR family transcriptional regulator [Cyanobacteriota bacterium]|nr:GntR family transcriptional regulator [Cyanobacteriota bacterium]
MRLHVQPQSGIPASTQLVTQISFAIACGHYPQGYRLPSTRQLAMQTGLHRNTISKVYHQLEAAGLVETRAGSGIYVSASEQAVHLALQTHDLADQKAAYLVVKQGLNQLLKSGCSLSQARDLFLAEIDWRLRCSAQVLLCVPQADLGTGQLMLRELETALSLPIQLVPLEDLPLLLTQSHSATLVTIPYFRAQVEAVADPWAVRVIPIEIYDYQAELEQIQQLPPDRCLGLVSLSRAMLGVAEAIVYSLRGEEILVLTATADERDPLRQMVRRADLLIADAGSYATVKALLREARPDLIRLPPLLQTHPHIKPESLALLKRELGDP